MLPLLGWTLLVFFSAWWNVKALDEQAYGLAAERGRHVLRLVQLARRWNRSHGGVYVPVTDEVQPNPYLKVPDRDVTTTDGRRLTRINSSYMARQLAELAAGDDTAFHVTSLDPLRPENAADPWETRALQWFDAGRKEVFELQRKNGEAQFRFMIPLMVEASCLVCHGGQGYRVGDVRGGISVSMKAQPFFDAQARHRDNLISLHVVVYLLIAGLIYLFSDRSRRQMLALEQVKDQQEALIARRTEELAVSNRQLEAEIRVREQARDDIHKAWRELDSLVEWAPDAMLTATAEGHIVRVNAQAAELFGYTRDELSSMTVASLIPERFRRRHLDYWTHFFSNPGKRRTGGRNDLMVLARGGREIAVEIGLNHTRREGRSLAIVTLRDVTERKHYEQELRRARDEAEAANRAKSSFLANMSHEIRTPMNAILGIGYLLQESGLEAKQRRYVEKIRVSAQTLLRLLNDILDLSKVEAGRLDLENMDFALDQLLDQTGTIVGIGARDKGIAVNIEAGVDTPNVLKGDPLRLQQVLINLMGNAVKFTDKGQVSLRVAPVEIGPDRIRLEFVVRDTGIGIPKDQQQRLFEAFSQAESSTTRRYGGTGLGLAISQHLVNLMGGELAVRSEEGRGSVFSFVAEFEPGDAGVLGGETLDGDGGDRHRARLQGANLLLVEDDRINQEVTKDILQRAGAQVACADSGEAALEQIERQGRPFDGILMDVQMPGMDGFETVRRIRRQADRGGLPIIALTASTRLEDRERCLAAGMNDFVPKPIDVDRLLSTLQRWVGAVRPADADADAPNVAGAPLGVPDLPGIDGAEIMQRLDGNLALLHRLLAEFADTQAEAVSRLQLALNEGRADDATRMAHNLKGVGGNLAASELQLAAGNVELAARAGDLAGAVRLLPELERAVKQVIAGAAVLEAAMPTQVQSLPAQVTDAEEEPLGLALHRLIGLLHSHDMAAEGRFEEIRARLAQHLGSTEIALVARHVRELDYRSAAGKLESFVESAGLD